MYVCVLRTEKEFRQPVLEQELIRRNEQHNTTTACGVTCLQRRGPYPNLHTCHDNCGTRTRLLVVIYSSERRHTGDRFRLATAMRFRFHERSEELPQRHETAPPQICELFSGLFGESSRRTTQRVS